MEIKTHGSPEVSSTFNSRVTESSFVVVAFFPLSLSLFQVAQKRSGAVEARVAGHPNPAVNMTPIPFWPAPPQDLPTRPANLRDSKSSAQYRPAPSLNWPGPRSSPFFDISGDVDAFAIFLLLSLEMLDISY